MVRRNSQADCNPPRPAASGDIVLESTIVSPKNRCKAAAVWCHTLSTHRFLLVVHTRSKQCALPKPVRLWVHMFGGISGAALQLPSPISLDWKPRGHRSAVNMILHMATNPPSFASNSGTVAPCKPAPRRIYRTDLTASPRYTVYRFQLSTETQ